jgi:hypothetical protein
MKQPPRQVRLEKDLEDEIKKIAEVTALPQIEIIRQVIKAGIQAVIESGGELHLPLRLKVIEREIPKASSSSRYPIPKSELNEAQETPAAAAPPPKKKKAA